MWTVYYKSTGEMVATGYSIPNPFSRDGKNRLNTASFHEWVVHPDYRRSEIAILMYGCTSKNIYKEGIRRGSWPLGADNVANIAMVRKMMGKRDRRHLILEYKLN